LALDSKLRACDLVKLRVDDVALNGRVRSRAAIMQRMTGRPVQFETTEQTREAVGRWIEKKNLHKGEPLFPSRINRQRSMTTRQYGRLLGSWFITIGLDDLPEHRQSPSCPTHARPHQDREYRAVSGH
jgi:integrase